MTRKVLTNIFKALFVLVFLAFVYPVGYFVLEVDPEMKGEDQSRAIPHHQGGIIAYIINLDRSKERYEYVKPNVDRLGIPSERISAVEGQALSDKEINEIVDMQTYFDFLGHFPKKGTIGCSLSHIKAWKALLDSPFEYAVIFEDDVRFDPLKLHSVIAELIKIDQDWDITIFEVNHRGLPLMIKSLTDGQKLVIYLAEVSHTGAYMLNRKAAKKLLEKSLPIKMPIDHYFTRAWEFGLKFTGIENPRLVRQAYGTSEINKTHQLSQEQSNVFSWIRKRLYRVQSCTIRFIYNVKCYVES
jgi:GR25 family glycosyltransferase involved in LPS biosynthesis